MRQTAFVVAGRELTAAYDGGRWYVRAGARTASDKRVVVALEELFPDSAYRQAVAFAAVALLEWQLEGRVDEEDENATASLDSPPEAAASLEPET